MNRLYFQLRSDDRELRRFISTLSVFLWIEPIVVASLVGVVAIPIVNHWGELPGKYLALSLLSTALTISASTVPSTLLRLQERRKDYMVLTGVQVCVQTISMLLFIVMLDMGPTGWFISIILGSVAMLITGLFVLRESRRIEFSWLPLRASLTIGVPIVPHTLAHWGLNLADRVLIAIWLPSAQLGVYSVAYQIGAVLGICSTVLNQAVIPEYGKSTAGIHDTSRLALIMKVQIILVGSAGIVLAAAGPAFLSYVLPSSFTQVREILPWVAVGYTFFGLYFIPMDWIVVVRGKTRSMWRITGVAAAVNIASNVIFVPRYGTTAAAVSTTVGYAALLAGMTLYAQRHAPGQDEDARLWKWLWKSYFIVAAISTIPALLTPSNLISGVLLSILLTSILAASVIVVSPGFLLKRDARRFWYTATAFVRSRQPQ